MNARVSDGGGVGLYLQNMVEALSRAGHEVFVVSSGYLYAMLDDKPRMRRRRSAQPGVHYYDVVNSPVGAPSFVMFPDPIAMVECPPLVDLFRDFMQRHGPFDIFHVQNVEGISFDVLSVAEAFPETKVILTNHNYHLVCQQANLWRQDKERCTSFDDGARCHVCNKFGHGTDEMVIDRLSRFHGLDRSPRLRRAVARAAKHLLGWRRRFGPLPWDPPQERRHDGRRIGPADAFRVRRARALEQVNRHCTTVLSVSQATENILLTHGLDPRLSRVAYIGTRHHDPARTAAARAAAPPHLRLAFLGYTRPDKGFQFLAKALEAMPDRLEGCFSLLVAARISDLAAVARLQASGGQLAGLEIRDGYKQGELPELLSQVDLGLVLPQWDDALPQVAIEFVCHGVPILVSDRGGQQELAADPAFVYSAESAADFWTRLEHLWLERRELERFWSLPRPLRTVDEHAAELLDIYAEA